MATETLKQEPFPVRTREATGLIGTTPTEVTRVDFTDKILLTISQGGRLSQWVSLDTPTSMHTHTHTRTENANIPLQIQVPLTVTPSTAVELPLPSSTTGLLPSTHLTPSTLLGGGGETRETYGHLYAAQIASHISLRDRDDRRTLVVGMGLERVEDGGREAFFDLVELAQKVL